MISDLKFRSYYVHFQWFSWWTTVDLQSPTSLTFVYTLSIDLTTVTTYSTVQSPSWLSCPGTLARIRSLSRLPFPLRRLTPCLIRS